MRFIPSAAFIARKELWYSVRHRETVLWVFIMPIVFFYFIGTITGGFTPTARKPSISVVVPDDAGVLAQQVLRRIEEQGFEVVSSPRPPEAGPPRRELTFPAGFTDAVLAGTPMTVELVRRGDGLGADYDQVRVARAVYTVLADLAVIRQQEGAPVGPAPLPSEAFEELDRMPRALSLEVRPAGKRQQVPTGFEQAIPGTMVMFTMMVLLTTGAVPLVIERQQGQLRRLASAPLPRGSIVAGKWAGRLALGLVQIGFAVVAGTVLFGMQWGASLPMVLQVLAAWASLNASLALLLGSLARSEAQAAGIGVISTMCLAALGGCWWPIEVVADWMQRLALFLPTGWTMDAMHRLVSFGAPASAAVPHVLALAAVALVTGWLATRVFRFQ
jgi:ABC-type Na+ efflux pump permease subunit